MKKFLLFTTTSIALALAAKVTFANPAHPTGDQPQAMQGSMMSEGMMSGDMMGGNMMSGPMMKGGMMSGSMPGNMMGNMMGGGMMHPDMMIIMLDTDGDGSLSLEEFQSMHERMFKYMDANKDGKIEASELGGHPDGEHPCHDADTDTQSDKDADKQ